MEKNNLEDECDQDQDPGASNRPQMFAEIEEMKQNLKKSERNRSQSMSSKTQKSEDENARRSIRVAKRQKPLTVQTWTASDLDPTTGMTQSVTPTVSPSASSPIEIAPGGGITQLPEEVFQHILGFVTFDDIKAVRHVNKHWRQMATTALRRSSKEVRLDHLVFECFTKMDDGQFPVYRFEVQLHDDPEKIKICHPYFSGICGWVKELTLKMDMDLNSYDKAQIQVGADMFPRDCIYQDLTHLNLRLFERTPKTRNPALWQRFTDFVQSILVNSPNLRDVSVNYLNNKSVKLRMCRVIEDLFPTSNSVGTSKLTCIDFQDVPFEKIDLAKWSTLNLKLRKLGINLPRSSDLIDLLAKFLHTQTVTLKELSLNLDCCDYKTPAGVAFTFPRMEILEQLGFTGHVYCNNVVTFPGIDYARLFPSLKKLDLRRPGIGGKDFIWNGDHLLNPTNTVEELIFPWTGVGPTPIVAASNLFPCLRKLEIHEHKVVIEAVCENMPNLEVLSVIGGYFSLSDNPDYLITGLESEVCKTFRGVVTETWIKKLKTAEGRSMARLQNLKTLKLSNRSSRLICFSRLSFHVFQQMSSLKCLDLNGRAYRQGLRGYYNDEKEKQFLADLRSKFVVLYNSTSINHQL